MYRAAARESVRRNDWGTERVRSSKTRQLDVETLGVSIRLWLEEVLTLLIDLIVFLRSGVVLPARVGADGRPEAVDHVLELQEELLKQKKNNVVDSGSESE